MVNCFAPSTPWEWERDAEGRSVAYVGLDATSVPQQGPDAKKAEGRMPWVGSVFNPEPMHERESGRKSTADTAPKPCETTNETSESGVTVAENRKRPRAWRSCYVSGVMTLDEIGQQLRCGCQAVGIASKDVVIGLTDGGNGLETCLLETVLSGPGT